MSTAIATVGLGFGDEGKGTVVDHLSRVINADLVIRYCGGCQAGHNVVTPDGRHHTFSQWGSGTFNGVATWLHRNMIIDPFAMEMEAAHLVEVGIDDPFGMLVIDPECMITTPYHVAANRFKEKSRGDARHGSCGMGIGECRRSALDGHKLTIHDLHDQDETEMILTLLMGDVLRDLDDAIDPDDWCQPNELADAYCRWFNDRNPLLNDSPWFIRAILEGSQGILLDESVGFAPHNTWSDVTLRAAKQAVDQCGATISETIGITRTFITRHGAGPFNTERVGATCNDHNSHHEWQGSFRIGDHDMDLLSYAIRNAGGDIDSLAVTWMDESPFDDVRTVDVRDRIATTTNIPISIESYGRTYEHKRLA